MSNDLNKLKSKRNDAGGGGGGKISAKRNEMSVPYLLLHRHYWCRKQQLLTWRRAAPGQLSLKSTPLNYHPRPLQIQPRPPAARVVTSLH